MGSTASRGFLESTCYVGGNHLIEINNHCLLHINWLRHIDMDWLENAVYAELMHFVYGRKVTAKVE